MRGLFITDFGKKLHARDTNGEITYTISRYAAWAHVERKGKAQVVETGDDLNDLQQSWGPGLPVNQLPTGSPKCEACGKPGQLTDFGESFICNVCAPACDGCGLHFPADDLKGHLSPVPACEHWEADRSGTFLTDFRCADILTSCYATAPAQRNTPGRANSTRKARPG